MIFHEKDVVPHSELNLDFLQLCGCPLTPSSLSLTLCGLVLSHPNPLTFDSQLYLGAKHIGLAEWKIVKTYVYVHDSVGN